jgi:hypothetical protein
MPVPHGSLTGGIGGEHDPAGGARATLAGLRAFAASRVGSCPVAGVQLVERRSPGLSPARRWPAPGYALSRSICPAGRPVAAVAGNRAGSCHAITGDGRPPRSSALRGWGTQGALGGSRQADGHHGGG